MMLYTLVVFLPLMAAAGQSSTYQQLIDEITHTVSCRNITGLAVSIVHDDRTWLSRGFGYAQLADDKLDHGPVHCTEKTKFVIASLSKAFTATLIGILLYENEHR